MYIKTGMPLAFPFNFILIRETLCFVKFAWPIYYVSSG